MRLSLAAGSGSVLPQGDDDVVAEGLELPPGVAGLAAAGHGAAGFLPPASSWAGGQAAEPLAEERVGVRRCVSGQDGDPLGVSVAVPLLPPARAGPDCRAVGVRAGPCRVGW